MSVLVWMRLDTQQLEHFIIPATRYSNAPHECPTS